MYTMLRIGTAQGNLTLLYSEKSEDFSSTIKKDNGITVKRIYPEEPKEINEKQKVVQMDVNNPLFVIGIKDTVLENKEELVKKHIAIEILLYMLIGKSSKLYQKLYEEGLIISQPDLDYEFSKEYAHITISGQSNNPEELFEMFKNKVNEYIQNGINEQDAERTKKMIYGEYIKEYNDVTSIARMFLSDYFKGINSFDYLEEINTINVEYLNQVLKDVFNQKNMILSVVRN